MKIHAFHPLAQITFFAALAGSVGAAQQKTAELAPTPPMGWNSWDSYGPAIREDEVKANVDAMASRLKAAGWQYMVVDIEWYQPDAHAHGYIARGKVTMDDYGRFVPSPSRFPSAANGNGFKGLADYAHSKGLKFGIHIMRGIPREAVDKNLPIEGTSFHAADVADKVNVCVWKGMEDTYGVDMSKPGGQAYYDSIARLYAQWGVDYVKADDMSRPYRTSEIHALRAALNKTGRPIVLSLSPGPAPVGDYADAKENAQLWRISNDFWDRWKDVRAQFDYMKQWQGKVHPGGFPDADMLPLGHIGIRAERGVDRSSLLTHDEQYTLMSLWSIFRSPLMMGGDLPTSDAFTYELLTNKEVLNVDQHSDNGREAYRDANIIAWTADAPNSGREVRWRLQCERFGTEGRDAVEQVGILWRINAPDLWQHKDSGRAASIKLTLRPHASVLYALTAIDLSEEAVSFERDRSSKPGTGSHGRALRSGCSGSALLTGRDCDGHWLLFPNRSGGDHLAVEVDLRLAITSRTISRSPLCAWCSRCKGGAIDRKASVSKRGQKRHRDERWSSYSCPWRGAGWLGSRRSAATADRFQLRMTKGGLLSSGRRARAAWR